MREVRMKRGVTGSARWRAVSVLVLALMLGSFGSSAGVAAVKGVTKKKADRKFLQTTTIVQQTFTVGNMEASPLSVQCPPGLQAVGGGVDSPALVGSGGGSDIMIPFEQRPIVSGARSIGWYVEAAGSGTGTSATVYAVCSK
jgi:hypothetical protein